jgi:FecR protein
MYTRQWVVFSALVALSSFLTIPSFADSQARIVRLSQVDGDVQIDRNTGQGYEKAFINLPVTQGTKLRTGADARAEIEFEDGSTLRLTPGTTLEFPMLARRDSGARASDLELATGTAYLNFKGKKNDEFSLAFGPERLTFTDSAHLRVELRDTSATVAVFNGDAEVEGSSGKVHLDKKHSATFDLSGNAPYTLANNLEPDPYDDWDKQQDKYHQQYTLASSNGYAYGTSDLNYYGSFYNMPGYGMMWQPYLAGAGWDPFMNGAWSWYPGAGYAWVSAYPWGWTPYRYGSWTFLPTYGWFWQPGSSWAGWNTVPRIANAPQHFSVPRPPSTPGQTLVVNRSGALASPVLVQNGAELRAGSAGLGVARGSVRNFGKVSQQIERPALAQGTMRTPPSQFAVRAPSGSSRAISSHGGAASSRVTASPQMSSGSGSSAPSAHGSSTHR